MELRSDAQKGRRDDGWGMEKLCEQERCDGHIHTAYACAMAKSKEINERFSSQHDAERYQQQRLRNDQDEAGEKREKEKKK